MIRTDCNPIKYIKGTSRVERRFCRNFIVSIREQISNHEAVVIATSGGIDSTVLAHAIHQGLIIQPYTNSTIIASLATYVNHNLRKEALDEEKFINTYVGNWHNTIVLHGHVSDGPGIQERARKIRYNILFTLCESLANRFNSRVSLLTAHNANDEAETKLFQYLTGRVDNGISHTINKPWGTIIRPMLGFSRKDIERYASNFQLQWMNDSSNDTDKYTRNKIRHHLIPWIEENVNSGIVKILSKEYR